MSLEVVGLLAEGIDAGDAAGAGYGEGSAGVALQRVVAEAPGGVAR